MPDTDYAIIGRVRKPQGIRGEVTVELLTDEPDRFFAPGRRVFAGTVDGELALPPRELTVEHSTPFRGGLIVKFDVIADRTAAEPWRLRYLMVRRDELTPPSEDEVFLHDLVGLEVRDDAGELIGKVAAFYELPQGVALEVTREGKGDVLVPYQPTVVREVDLDARTITVDVTSGLFE
ncbi:MAG TPA: ribosome maturation factor RimM [Gaiellaceae bacterium]|nr:ribosome maturation factor RimM [Gaiellaceae bacterium]